jgi:PrtD family type I secretion system ABC transporter
MSPSSRNLSFTGLLRFYPLASVFCFSMFINLLMLTAPLYMLQVYDRVLASGSLSTLWALSILAITALATMAVLEAIRSTVLGRVALRIDEEIGNTLFPGVLQAQIEQNPHAGRYFGDLDAIRNFLSGQGPSAWLDAPWVPLYLVMIYFFHPLLGAVAAGGAVVLFIIAFINELASRKPSGDAAEAIEKSDRIRDAVLRSSQAVGAMGMLPALQARWYKSRLPALLSLGRASGRAGSIQSISRSARQALQIAMLGVGAALVLDNAISPGIMIVASIIMGRALSPVEQTIGNWRAMRGARRALERLSELLRTIGESTEERVLPPPGGVIEFEKVVCAPPGSETPVLKYVSFRVEPGEVLGIVGPSGAGKSSLVKVLAGLWRTAVGSVRIDGVPVANFDADALRERVGFLPQEIELLEGSIAENISRFQEDPDPERILQAAQLAGTHDLITKFPEGYETALHNTGQPLSGGQRQRVGITRALYGNPAIVVLDEPSANLDREGEETLLATLQALKARGQTVVLVAHRPSLLAVADKVLVMRDGKVLAFGPTLEILPKVLPPKAQSTLSPALAKSA